MSFITLFSGLCRAVVAPAARTPRRRIRTANAIAQLSRALRPCRVPLRLDPTAQDIAIPSKVVDGASCRLVTYYDENGTGASPNETGNAHPWRQIVAQTPRDLARRERPPSRRRTRRRASRRPRPKAKTPPSGRRERATATRQGEVGQRARDAARAAAQVRRRAASGGDALDDWVNASAAEPAPADAPRPGRRAVAASRCSRGGQARARKAPGSQGGGQARPAKAAGDGKAKRDARSRARDRKRSRARPAAVAAPPSAAAADGDRSARLGPKPRRGRTASRAVAAPPAEADVRRPSAPQPPAQPVAVAGAASRARAGQASQGAELGARACPRSRARPAPRSPRLSRLPAPAQRRAAGRPRAGPPAEWPTVRLRRPSIRCPTSKGSRTTSQGHRTRDKVITAYMRPRGAGEIKPTIAEEVGEMVRSLGQVVEYYMADPRRAFEAQTALTNQFVSLWASTLRRFQGQSATRRRNGRRQALRRRRMAQQPVFRLPQAGLRSDQRLGRGPGPARRRLEPHARDKAAFYLKQVSAALSPSNFRHQPRAHSRDARRERREPRARPQDARRGHRGRQRQLRIRQADASAFKLGVNMANTPGKVIFRNDLIELIQYAPSTTEVYRRPLLIVPPWINKFYILDLNPEKSFIRWAVAQGLTVFVVSWVNPDARHADMDFDAYMREGILAALDAVEQATGEREGRRSAIASAARCWRHARLYRRGRRRPDRRARPSSPPRSTSPTRAISRCSSTPSS